ncbi:MAG: class I SAM-dependent methyltransferase [Gemmatimonadaceae bacterium]
MSSPAYEIAPCPVCGDRESTEVAGPDEMRAEVEALWEFHTRRLRPDTPPEQLLDRVAFSLHPPLRVVECATCGLIYRNPRERERELRDTYQGEEPDRATLESLLENQRVAYQVQVRRLAEEMGRAGTGLEVGSYVGAFLDAARDEGWQFEGLDVNPVANEFTRQRGHRVSLGDLESLDAARRYDAIAIWNCFDQLPDPRAAAAKVRALLAPGGVVAIRVPNGAFYARVRTSLHGPAAPAARALLAHNNLLAFPYRHGFTLRSLALLLGKVGLAITRTHGDPLVPIADEWTRGWAAAEERALKTMLRALSHAGSAGAEASPWIEVYARHRDQG